MRTKMVFLVIAPLCLIVTARAQAPFGISSVDFGSARLAKISFKSSGKFVKPTGVSYGGWSCGNGNCVFFDFPLTQSGYSYTTVFSYEDWRIAAECSSGTGWELCALPDSAEEAWIELRENSKDLTVLFPKKKAPKDLEKSMHSRFMPIVYHIISVHNVKTNETWPKTLNDLMQK